MTSLNPVLTVGRQIGEVLRRHQRHARCGRAQPGGRAARPGRHPAARAARRRVPAPALRRHAAAGDDRHGGGLPAQAARRRRADHRAGRDRPGRHPRRAARPADRDRHRGPAHHPRPRRGGRHRRPGRGHVRRAGRRGGRHRRRCSRGPATRTRTACSTRCPTRPGTPTAGCGRSPGRVPTLRSSPDACTFADRCALRRRRRAAPAKPELDAGPGRAPGAVLASRCARAAASEDDDGGDRRGVVAEPEVRR